MRTAEIIDLAGHDDSPRRALEVGKAAEHLVCADLILAGHKAFLSDQGLPYDLIVDLGKRLIRVQVKSTYRPIIYPDTPNIAKYSWTVRRVGKGARRIIGNDEFDILALVGLDLKAIGYVAITDKVPTTIRIRPPNISLVGNKLAYAKALTDYKFSDALKDLK